MNKLKNSHTLLLLLVFCCLTAITQTAKAQFTSIPDTIFEQYLIAEGIDSDGMVNGQVLTSDVATVTKVNMNSWSLRSLVGIEDFVALEYLEVRNSRNITQLDLSTHTQLDTVIVSVTDIVTLDLRNSNNLHYLVFQQGPADTLILPPNLSNLNYVTVNNTNLDSLPSLVGAVNLQTLRISLTGTRNLDLSSLTGLKYLYAESNQITQVDLSNLPVLERLNIGANQLTQLDCRSNPLLEWLTVAGNNLTSIDLSNNPVLDYLTVGNNNLTTIDISNNALLTTFYGSYNNLSSIDLTNNTELSFINLQNTPLTHLDLSPCQKLVTVRLDNNILEHLELNDSTLYELRMDYSSRALKDIDLKNNRGLTVFRVGGASLTHLDLSNCPIIREIRIHDNNIQYLRLNNDNIATLVAHGNLPGMTICFTQTTPLNINHLWWTDDNVVYTNGCNYQAVRGRVVLDDNNNCTKEPTEAGLKNRLVQFEDATGHKSHTLADELGYYIAYLDTGRHVSRIVSPHLYQVPCNPVQTLTVDTNSATNRLDWLIQNVVNCPHLTVDIAAPLLRNATWSTYTVQYCNNGTQAADNAYVEVELDPHMSYVNATIPLTNQTGQTLRFDLDTVQVETCNSFQINVQLDTINLIMGQTHCTQAHIYPDSSCVPIWSGAILDASAICNNDTVFFEIENKGAAMSQATNYFVFEDNIMMRQGTVQLGAAGILSVQQAASVGKTYRISVKQETGFPLFLGDSLTTAAIEGCNPFPNGTFNIGFINQFSNGNSAPFIAVDCQSNVNAYDPNDKAAQPVGYGAPHYIEKNTALDYKIRFQNTGTDTAFNITILDTLSPYLDISTLQMGASSHSYTWSIQGGNTLRVTFANIMLPDSNVNEPLSNGFFRYRIEQQANNPLGTVINNQAAIYFDYNPPIFTNTTFHTIGENFIPIQLVNTQVLEHKIDIKIYPNPFTYSTTLEIQGQSYEQLEVVIYDATGRIMQVITGQGEQLQIERGNLTTGFYFYELKGNGQRIATGKVVVQ